MVRLAALSRGMVMLLVCTTPATLSARFVGERDASWHYLAHLGRIPPHPRGTLTNPVPLPYLPHYSTSAGLCSRPDCSLLYCITPSHRPSSTLRTASCPQVRRALASGVPVPGDIAPRPRHCIGLLAVPWSRREQTRILVAPHTLAAGLSTWRTFASPVPLAVSLSWRFQLAAPLPRLAPVQRNSFRCGPRAPVTGTLLSCKVL